MPYEIAFGQRPPLLTVTVKGPLDLETCQAILADVATHLALHQYPPVLADSREATPLLTATEIYQLTSELADAGLGKRSRLAVVTIPRPGFDRAGFLQRIAGHRGLQIQVFLDREEALRWLTE